MRKVYIDTKCEASDLLQGPNFFPVDSLELQELDAVYVVSRWTMSTYRNAIRDWINQGGRVVYYNATEASETMLGQMKILGMEDFARQRKLLILAGGACDPAWKQLGFEYLLIKLFQYTSPIDLKYAEKKPYKFLFLNGRLRHHRKWLLAKMRIHDLLDQGLWSCLQTYNQHRRGLTLYHNQRDLMQQLEPLHLLPMEFEHPSFRENRDLVGDEFKTKLFNDTWGDGLLYYRPYEHTYFSIVTETVFDGMLSFRTEKIWKPILAGHPWIAVANADFYRDMHRLGFQSYGDLIDETFDGQRDGQKRLEHVFRTIQSLCDSDLDQFMLASKSISAYNKQRALELVRQQRESLPEQVRKFIDE